MPVDVSPKTAAELTAAIAELIVQRDLAHGEIDRLRSRLEIDHAWNGRGEKVSFTDGWPDGIECRDETIRGLEEQIARLTTALAEAEARGRRQERYDILLLLAEGADRGAPFHAAVSAIASLASAPVETQKPETGESVR